MHLSVSQGFDQSVIKNLVQAFTDSTKEVVNEVREENGWFTGNFQNGGTWDTRFKRIKDVGLKNELVVLTRKRGIWKFICILNLETGILYIFSKEDNFEKVAKKLGRKSIHYFHALVSLNSDPLNLDNQQLEFFPKFTDEYESKRLTEVQKLLGDEYPLVNKVVFVIAEEQNKNIVGVQAKLYNRYFELIDIEDWSSYISNVNYNELLVSGEEFVDMNNTEEVIPRVKQSIKERKTFFDKKNVKKKEEKRNIKEE